MIVLKAVYGIIVVVVAAYAVDTAFTAILLLIKRCYVRSNKAKLVEEIKEVNVSLLKISEEQIRGDLLVITKQLEEVIMQKLINEKSLTDLLATTAKKEDYDEFIDVLTPVLKDLYKNYQFQLFCPTPDDLQSGYAIRFQIFRMDMDEDYNKLFRMAIDKGMTERDITLTFYDYVKEGNLIDLGDAEVMLLGTGISSILSGADLDIYITFMPKKYKEKKEAYEAKLAEEKAEQEKEKEAYMEQRNKTFETLTEATEVLSNLTKEIKEELPEKTEELEEVFEEVRDLYGKV